MSRTNDEFDSVEKERWREDNFRFLRKEGRLMWDGPRLLGSWVELVGRSGGRSRDMLVRNGAIESDSQYVGVDRSWDRIDEHRRSEAAFRTVHNDVTTAVLDMLSSGQRVSILNYDGYNAAAVEGWWKEDGYAIGNIVRQAVQAFGEFGLVLNHVLRGKLRKEDAIESHMRMAEKYLKVGPLSRENVIDYVSEKSPMATIQILFTRSGHSVGRRCER